MGFVNLAENIVFDTNNEEGRLIHAENGTCFALNQIATLLLQAALCSSTQSEAIVLLHTHIAASSQQLDDGLHDVIQKLVCEGVIHVTSYTNTLHPMMTASPIANNAENSQASIFAIPIETQERQQQEYHPGQKIAWEFFLTGKICNRHLPPYSIFQRSYAIRKTIYALLLLGCDHCLAAFLSWLRACKQAQIVQQHAWQNICRYLTSIPPHPSATRMQQTGEAEILYRLARRELTICQIITRLLAPAGKCLVRSVAFCSYLRSLGFPAQVVIGRARFGYSSDDEFHAWVELAGRVVNDHDELQTGYTVIQRVPPTFASNIPHRIRRMSLIKMLVVITVIYYFIVHKKKGKKHG